MSRTSYSIALLVAAPPLLLLRSSIDAGLRATSAGLQDDKVRLEAGAAVSAGRIDVTIRRAYGHVRFRSNLDALNRLFGRP